MKKDPRLAFKYVSCQASVAAAKERRVSPINEDTQKARPPDSSGAKYNDCAHGTTICRMMRYHPGGGDPSFEDELLSCNQRLK